MTEKEQTAFTNLADYSAAKSDKLKIAIRLIGLYRKELQYTDFCKDDVFDDMYRDITG